MIIHQSIYGDVGNAWALIKTSHKDNTIAKNLALKTDLTEQTIGITWQPAIRGFRVGDYYLIIKTFDDTTKGVRRGRKFSHVLTINCADIIKSSTIKPFFDLLIKDLDKSFPVVEITLEIEEENHLLPTEIEGRLCKIINGYIHQAEYKNKLLWVGQDYFDIAVEELWKRLTPAERESFHFGITFNNDNKASDGINLFAVPDSVANKFIKTEYFIVRKNDVHIPEGLLEKVLWGNDNAIARVNNFQKVINSKPFSRSEIASVEKGLETFEQIETVTDLKKLNTLSHLIARYSPEADMGMSFKEKLLEKITQQLENVSYKDLHIFRMFKIDSFHSAREILTDVLVRFIKKNILSNKSQLSNLSAFFENFKEDSRHWWDIVMVEELKQYLNIIDQKKIRVIYIYLTEVPSILQKVGIYFDRSNEAQDYLISGMPVKLNAVLLQELINFSLDRQWYILYATLLLKKYTLESSLTELLKVDINDNHYAAIEIIIAKKSKKSVIAYTILTGNERLIKICGRLCHEEPALLGEIDHFNHIWQQIWIEAINFGNTLTDGLKAPSEEIPAILDGLIEGKTIPEFLIEKISESEFANLIEYPKASQIWNVVHNIAKNNFLNKTSAALLEELSKNASFVIPDDQIIERHLSGKGISDYLYYNSNNIKSVVPLFKRFIHLTDQNLKDYLQNYHGDLEAITAKQLGSLVYKRQFKKSAEIINKKSTKYNSWRFALAECYHLLDFISRGILAFAGVLDKVNIPTDQWWDALQEVITELYSNGNSLTTIWKKAGGKESDLLITGSSADVWSNLLHRLRHGKINDVTTNNLLTEINKQYGSNNKFEMIYKLRATYIKMK